MQIIFRLRINKNNQRTFWLVLLTLLLTHINSQNCSAYTVQTSFTRCLIKLDLCSQNPSMAETPHPSPYYRFSSCQMTHCSTLGVNSQCRNPVIIDLNQQNCFKSCCRSDTFNPQQCAATNIELRQAADTVNGYIAIILGMCALGLLIASSCFIVNRLRCFRRKEELEAEPQLPVWRRAAYRDNKCCNCDQYGAEVQTVCRHYFHLQCIKEAYKDEELTGSCLACKETSSKLRLWCNECHERYIKISVGQIRTADQLQVYYNQAKILHLECERDLLSAKTDVRLTSTATNE